MRFKFTIFLLALNCITFGVIAYLNHQASDMDASSGGLSGQIGRELIDAERIELSGRGLEVPRVLERNGSTWTLTAPMQWSANYFAINRILNQLQFLEEEASFPVSEITKTGQTLADYGLEDPLLTLSITEGDETNTLSIGTTTEIGNNVYLLGPNKQEIFVVSGQVIAGLLVDLDDLRNREIFSIPVFEVDALGLQMQDQGIVDGGTLKVRLARSSNSWRFEAPLSATADPELVANTINTLTAAKVGRFVEPEEQDPIVHGLESPSMQVTIHGNKRRQTLLLGNLDPKAPQGAQQFFAKLEDNPAVFTVLAEPFEALRKAQDALRERNFMSFDTSLLSTIHIRENGRNIRLQKLETGNEWLVLESKGEADIQPHRADPGIISELIEDLSSLRATGFAVDAPSPSDNESRGFRKPRRVVTLTFSEGDPLTLTLAHPEDDNDVLYAKTNRADYIYQVERRATLRLFPLNSQHYRTRTLDKLPEAATITELALKDLRTDEIVLEASLPEKTDNWAEYLGENPSEQTQSIVALLQAIREFKVKNYRINRYEDAYPIDDDKSLPWVFELSATIKLPGGATDRTEKRIYVFTERLAGTVQVGGSKQHKAIFEISQSLIDTLHELTDDMKLPPEATGGAVETPPTIPPVPAPEAIPPKEESPEESSQ